MWAILCFVVICLAAPANAAESRLVVVPQPVPPLFAPLHPPTSGGEITTPNQEKSDSTPQPPDNDKRGTKDAPLIVEMANPPNGDAIAAEIKKIATINRRKIGKPLSSVRSW
jgi:hypothetical protein